MIEQRRLVRLGRSTLVVSLPADWVKRKGLKAGDVLTLVINDNYIKIVPDMKKGTVKLTMTIRVKNRVEGLYRTIIASYVAGADIIKIEFEDPDSLFEIMKQVKMAISHTIGLEIVEQGTNYITLQAFISDTAQSAENLVSRITGLLSLMVAQLVKGHLEDKDYFEELENEIDKLYRLALRIMNTSPEPDALTVSLLTSLENASDTLIPLVDILKGKSREALDVLNIVKETLEFLQSYELGSQAIDKLDEKISILEHVEGELESRNIDERIKYRLILFIHNLKNAMLMLHNKEVTQALKKGGREVLEI